MEKKNLKEILKHMTKFHFDSNKDFLDFKLQESNASEEVLKIVKESNETLLKNIIAIIEANVK